MRRSTKERWVCLGRKRGWCGNLHYTRKEAYKCFEKELRNTKAEDIVTDRRVYSTYDFLVGHKGKTKVFLRPLICPKCGDGDVREDIVYHLGKVRIRHYDCKSKKCNWNDYAFDRDDIKVEMWRIWQMLGMPKEERPLLRIYKLKQKKRSKVHVITSWDKDQNVLDIHISKWASVPDIVMKLLHELVHASGYEHHDVPYKMLLIWTFNRLFWIKFHLRIYSEYRLSVLEAKMKLTLEKLEIRKSEKYNTSFRTGKYIPGQVKINLKTWKDENMLVIKKTQSRPRKKGGVK